MAKRHSFKKTKRKRSSSKTERRYVAGISSRGSSDIKGDKNKIIKSISIEEDNSKTKRLKENPTNLAKSSKSENTPKNTEDFKPSQKDDNISSKIEDPLYSLHRTKNNIKAQNIKIAFKAPKKASINLFSNSNGNDAKALPFTEKTENAKDKTPPKSAEKLRNFEVVKQRIKSFNENLSWKINERVLYQIDTEPSSIPLSNEFFEKGEEKFRNIDLIVREFREDEFAILVENFPTNFSIQSIGDWFNSALQSKLGESSQFVKNISAFPSHLGPKLLVHLHTQRALFTALELNNFVLNNNCVRISIAPPRSPFPSIAKPLNNCLAAPRPQPTRTSNWDQKIASASADWRAARDAIVDSDLPENRSTGFPVVVSNIPFAGCVSHAIDLISRQLDIQHADEVNYFNEARELAEGTIILMAKNKSLFNAIISLRDQISVQGRNLTIRPFVDDGSVKVSSLRKVHCGDH